MVKTRVTLTKQIRKKILVNYKVILPMPKMPFLRVMLIKGQLKQAVIYSDKNKIAN